MWNSTKFRLIPTIVISIFPISCLIELKFWLPKIFQLIQTIVISIFSISCLIELKFWLLEILWSFTKFFFKQMLKVSTFYLEKQKSFIPKKNELLSINKKALFTDPIFSEGFASRYLEFAHQNNSSKQKISMWPVW